MEMQTYKTMGSQDREKKNIIHYEITSKDV